MAPLRTFISTLASGLLITTAVGCARPLQQQVLGKWKHTGSTAQIELLKDGTVIYAFGPLQATGTFTTPDEKHLRTDLRGAVGALLGSQTYEARVGKNTLHLTLGTEPLTFTRVPSP